jgi:hypothetical protein
MMLFANIYRWRDDAHSKDAGSEIMKRYGELGGDGPGAIAHYVFADGTGGIILTDAPDLGHAYKASLRFNEFLDLDLSEVRPILPLDDALPSITEYLGG